MQFEPFELSHAGVPPSCIGVFVIFHRRAVKNCPVRVDLCKIFIAKQRDDFALLNDVLLFPAINARPTRGRRETKSVPNDTSFAQMLDEKTSREVALQDCVHKQSNDTQKT